MSLDRKPCPFCKSRRTEMFFYANDLSAYYHMKCNECHAQGPAAKAFEDALERWNERADVTEMESDNLMQCGNCLREGGFYRTEDSIIRQHRVINSNASITLIKLRDTYDKKGNWVCRLCSGEVTHEQAKFLDSLANKSNDPC